MAEQSLKDKTVKGTFWSAADAFLAQGVTFAVGIVLARLLSPEEYGLIGIVTIFTTIMAGIVDSGFSNSLIRKLEVSDDDFCTLFFVNIGVSFLMYALFFFGSPTIATFFERPQLISLCRVMGLMLVIQAFSIVQYTILSRRIDFKTKAKANVVSAILSGIVGITMAYMEFGVWSLAAQQLSRQLFYTVGLWCCNHWWPKMKFSFQSLKYMWGFGWKILVSGLLNSIWSELYQTVVAKCYSPATLGQYTRSKQYARLLSSNLTSVVQRVTYPVLAQIQDDNTRMVFAYRKVIKTTMFVTAVSMIFMGAIAEPLIYCLIGPQWHEAATYLPLICISMSLYPLHAINLNMLQVQNRTDIFLYLEIAKKIIAFGPLCLGIFVDIYWMLAGSIVFGIISFFLNSYYTGKKLRYSSWMQLRDVAPSYGVAFVIALMVYYFKYLPLSYWMVLPIQIAVGISVFFLLNEKLQLTEYKDVKWILKEYSGKLLKRK